MRVDRKCDKPLLAQVVDDPLHVLAISTHTAGEPCNRLRLFRSNYGTEYLPPCAREPKPRNKAIQRLKSSCSA